MKVKTQLDQRRNLTFMVNKLKEIQETQLELCFSVRQMETELSVLKQFCAVSAVGDNTDVPNKTNDPPAPSQSDANSVLPSVPPSVNTVPRSGSMPARECDKCTFNMQQRVLKGVSSNMHRNMDSGGPNRNGDNAINNNNLGDNDDM